MDTNNYRKYDKIKEDDELKLTYSNTYGKFGISNKNKNKSTKAFYDRIVTSHKYVFVKSGSHWGILDRDLSVILPMVFKEIIPVKLLDRDAFISSCLNADKPECLENGFNRKPYIVIQTKLDQNLQSFMRRRRRIHEAGFEEIDRTHLNASIYEIIQNYEDAKTSYFVVNLNNDYFLLNCEHSIYRNGKEQIFFLWHYKDEMFIKCDMGNQFWGFCKCTEQRFFQKGLIIWTNNGKIHTEENYSKITIFNDGFVSICAPEVFDSDNNRMSFSNKWALFKFAKNEMRTPPWHGKKRGEKEIVSYFEQLTPFVFNKPLKTIHKKNIIHCTAMGKEFLVQYNGNFEDKLLTFTKEETEWANALNTTGGQLISSSELKDFQDICFKGPLSVISSNFNRIQLREDGMFDVSSDDGFGLIDENLQVIIPMKYDNTIESLGQLNIVSIKNKYGVVNSQGEEIVPCVYECIQIGRKTLPKWTIEEEFDYDEVESYVTGYYLYNSSDKISSDTNLFEEGFIIAGINSNSEGKTQNNLTNYKKWNDEEDLKANCDIYLPDGKFLETCEVIPRGGIEYLQNYRVLLTYNTRSYAKYSRTRYDYGVQLCFYETNEKTEVFNSVMMINEHHFLAKKGINSGIVFKDDSNFSWIVPCEYDCLTFPINELVYAIKRIEYTHDFHLDIFDVSNEYKLLSSSRFHSNYPYTGLKYLIDDIVNSFDSLTRISNGLKERLIKDKDFGQVEFFPGYEIDLTEDCYNDSSDDYLKDAFEDDPESMWGRMD